MYVCNCAGIGEGKLEKLIDDEGARTVGEVYKKHGQKPGCGKCAAEIRDILAEGPKSGATAKESIARWKRRKLGQETAQAVTPSEKTGDADQTSAPKETGKPPPPDLNRSPVWPSCPANGPRR
ncbi:MAG: (2Fe-2S)-binding protein [Pseudomonadota bacterium]